MLGALARYALGGYISKINGTTFPYGTFFVNITGSFLIGLLGTLFIEKLSTDPQWRIFITIGFLGSFTTFSTLQYESLRLIETGMMDSALLNLFGSIGAGFTAAWLGMIIARWI